ncbi:MAG TPA: CHC2 zinc finger domain-containing protein, partial [Polyangiaceae bacterium]|nr:CHC2 zinc finger domain-containing protein [Polyangiaceae bacterium]
MMASPRNHTPAGGTSPSAWEDFKDRVRAASPLEDVVARDADLERHGSELVCESPLRSDDSTPSFSVNVEKQLWLDRGTGHGGDVFSYVMTREGVGFADAVRALARAANIPVPERSPKTKEEEKSDDERRAVEKILTEAATIYHGALDDERRTFLRKHYGFTDKFIDEEKLGYDPGGTHLWHELKQKGYSDEDLFKSGLFVEGTSHVGASRFHHRITMPYWRRGSVVYLCARSTSETPRIPKRKDGKVV